MDMFRVRGRRGMRCAGVMIVIAISVVIIRWVVEQRRYSPSRALIEGISRDGGFQAAVLQGLMEHREATTGSCCAPSLGGARGTSVFMR